MAEETIPTTGAEETPTATTTGDKATTVENKEGGDNTQKTQDGGAEIPVRRSARDYINERRSARLAKQEATKTPTLLDDDEDEDELEPTARKSIAREVSEQVSPLVKAQQDAADEAELRQVLTDHPDFKPFETAIRKNMVVHTSMPVLQLAYAVAGDKLMALGAAQKAKADKDARENNLGASTSRRTPSDGEPDYANMSKEEFEKELAKAKGQRR